MSEEKNQDAQRTEVYNQNINKICEITGWTRDKAEEKIKVANSLDISSNIYVKNECWNFSDKDLEWFAETRKASKLEADFDKGMYELILMDKTGWDIDKVRAKLKKITKMGFRKYDYIYKGLYLLADGKLNGRARWSKKAAIKRAERTQQWISKIMSKTGWSKSRAILEFNQAKRQTGCSYEDYCLLDFHKYSSKELDSFMTFRTSRIMRITLNHNFDNVVAINDKLAFNEQCSRYIGRAWFSTVDLDFDAFCRKTEGLDKIMVKPYNSTQGIGITSYDCNVSLDEKEAIYKVIMSLGKSIVEEYVVQHHEMAEFAPQSVNTIRVQSIYTDTESIMLFAAVRMGRGSVVDNFHAGGMAAIVDVDTGQVITPAVDIDENEYTVHPVSGKQILGAQIPNWDKVIEITNQLKGTFDGIGWIGWDFAITESGVDIIEGNPGGSYIAFQLPYAKKYQKGFMDRVQTIYSDIIADYEKRVKLLKKADKQAKVKKKIKRIIRKISKENNK